MANHPTIPNSVREAETELNSVLAKPMRSVAKNEFIRAWSSLAYLHPGLHPDGYEERGSGWPAAFRPMAAEAWRRADAGELSDDELYPSDAQWCGLYDQMTSHTPEEERHRQSLLQGKPR